MVANLNPASLQRVCTGLANEGETRSRGIVRCSLRKSERYDHKRHSALKNTKNPPQDELMEWDFVLETDLGTEISLHPHYGDTKVTCYKGPTSADHEIPRSGKGGRGKPGFRNIIRRQVHETLRFTACPRNPWGMPTAVAGPSASTAAGPSSSTASTTAGPSSSTAAAGSAGATGSSISLDHSPP